MKYDELVFKTAHTTRLLCFGLDNVLLVGSDNNESWLVWSIRCLELFWWAVGQGGVSVYLLKGAQFHGYVSSDGALLYFGSDKQRVLLSGQGGVSVYLNLD